MQYLSYGALEFLAIERAVASSSKRFQSKSMKAFLCIAILSTLLLGCGGNGKPISTFEQPIFVTASGGNFDHVWISVHSIDLIGSAGNRRVYDSLNGTQIDLANLGLNGIFQFLGVTDSAAGFTEVKIQLGRVLKVASTGGVLQDLTWSSIYPGTGKAEFRLPLTSQDLAINFDLDSLAITGTSASINLENLGTASPIPSQQIGSTLKGSINEITSGVNRTFILRIVGERNLVVETSPQTVVYHNDGSPSPVLKNGKIAEVSGRFDPATKQFLASEIILQTDPDVEFHPRIEGLASLSGSSDIQIDVQAVRGFLPSSNSLLILPRPDTVFTDGSGIVVTKRQFVVGVTPGTVVSSIGTAMQDTFESRILHVTGTSVRRIEAIGSATALDPSIQSISISLDRWFGFDGVNGTIQLAGQAGTVWQNEVGQTISAAQFFGELDLGDGVEVLGAWDGESVTADVVRLKGDLLTGSDPHEAVGSILSVAQDGEIVMNVSRWFGFDSYYSDSLPVVPDSSASFYDVSGTVLSREVFLQAITTGSSIEVEGLFSGGKLHAKRCRLLD